MSVGRIVATLSSDVTKEHQMRGADCKWVTTVLAVAIVAAVPLPRGTRAAAQAGTPAGAQELPPIRAFLQVNPQFCTGGQPRPEHFAMLKQQGVKAVLNLRTPGEHRAEEEQAAVEK